MNRPTPEQLLALYTAHFLRLEGLGYTFTDEEANPLTVTEAALRSAERVATGLRVLVINPP